MLRVIYGLLLTQEHTDEEEMCPPAKGLRRESGGGQNLALLCVSTPQFFQSLFAAQQFEALQ